MEDHESHYDKLTSLIQISEKKIRYLETTAVQLAVAQLIIQCILLYLALQPSSATVLRGKWWIPCCLSTSVSVAFFLTFTSAVWGCLAAKRQQDSIFMDQDGLYRKMYAIRNGQIKDDAAAAAASGRRRLAEAFRYTRCKRYAYAGFVSIALLFFDLLVLYAISFVLKHN